MRQFPLPTPSALLRLLLTLLLPGAARASRAQGSPLPLVRVAIAHDSLQQQLATQPRRDTLRTGCRNVLSFLLRTSEGPATPAAARQGTRLSGQHLPAAGKRLFAAA